MRNVYFIFVLSLVVSFFYGCNQDEKPVNPLEITVKLKSEPSLVRKFVNPDKFLDVDADALTSAVATRSQSVDADEVAKMKAAIYRFYNHVKVVEGKYVCDLKGAKDINVSDRLYRVLFNNLEDMNEWVDKCKKEGKAITVSEINDEYLNSLLN